MNKTLTIGALCLLAIIVGALFYFHPFSSSPWGGTQGGGKEAEVHFMKLDEGTSASTIGVRKNYAFYEKAEFADLWHKIHGQNSTPPLVDFSKEYVIGVFAGTEPTAGYRIAVTRIVDTAAQRSVAIAIEAPGAGCTPKMATTSPYQFITVPFTGPEELTHEDTQVTKDCR
jgi:hypothetical protein